MNSFVEKDLTLLSEMLFKASSVALAAHRGPDGDAVGSVMALAAYLGDVRGKTVNVFLPDRWPEQLSFLVGDAAGEHVFIYADDAEMACRQLCGCDLFICLDCSDLSRTGDLCTPVRELDVPKVLIDHHLNPGRDDFDLVFSDAGVSSTCELLYYLLRALGADAASLPAAAGMALMAGMTTDTNNFSNSVFPSTFSMASDLIAAGVDRDGVISNLFFSYRENRLRVMGRLLADEMKIIDDAFAYTVLRKDVMSTWDIREGELEGYVNMPLSVGNVRMSIFLKEDDGFFRVSVRSKAGESANRMAAAYFHGGGHLLASGGRLFFPGDIACPGDVCKYVEEAIRSYEKMV